MLELVDVLIKGGVGAVGFVASAYTLTKFILSTPVKIGPRDVEDKMDVVLCFDTKKFSSAAVEFFVQLVRAQSKLLITQKPKNDTHADEAKGLVMYYLVGADHNTLGEIKQRKEKTLHAELVQDMSRHYFVSGERINLIMFELERLNVRRVKNANAATTISGGDTTQAEQIVENNGVPPPFDEEEEGLLFQQALHTKLIIDYFFLHDDSERSKLMSAWVKQWKVPQPLNAVRMYFGDEVGFYFAFLGMYTTWLIAPAALGLLVFGLEFISDWSIYGRAIYSFVITSWATAFLKFWKRRESTLRNDWDVSPGDSMILETARTEFWGEKRYDVVEGKYYTYFSSIKRMKRYIVTSLVTLFVLVAILQLMFLYFHVDAWFQKLIAEEKGWDGYYQYISLAPSIVYSIMVLVLDAKYTVLAERLSQYENHRTDSDFANAQVLKLASFYFVNNFASLFYLAFRSRDMELLEQTLSSLLITRQMIGNVKEQLVPYLTATSSLKTEAGKIAKEKHGAEAVVSKVDAELLYPSYDGTFEDYLELFVQFGQITLFASAYPLAALWSLANNIMEIRSDAFKLCMSFRRPRHTTSNGIGAWLFAFNALGYISVLTNCAIFGLHSGLLDKLFPALSFAGILVTVGVMEHIMIAIKVTIEMLVPDTPTAVIEAKRMRRAALRKKASLQVELSSRKMLQEQQQSKNGNLVSTDQASADTDDELPTTVDKMKDWMHQEKERRWKLEQEVKNLEELFMGWIREEQAKRKNAELKLIELRKTSLPVASLPAAKAT